MNRPTDNEVQLPPIWCSQICRNAMNELCIESCAIKRNCSGFDPRPNLSLLDIPGFPSTENMSREERFASVVFYLSKVIEYLQGFECNRLDLSVRHSLNCESVGNMKSISQVLTVIQSNYPKDREDVE